ncbi:MAG TPA: hypothetical protein VKQ05_00270 [Gemmatimonadales bacterium]|nr:hypothetical protein [Gemmatimonadales bacterium]
MKRIAMAVAIVVMAAGACKKAQNANTAADSTSMRMSDSMKMAPTDTAKARADSVRMADSMKAHRDTTHRTTTRPRTRRP